MSGNTPNQPDLDIWWIVLVAMFAIASGALSLGAVFDPVKDWMLESQILVTGDVVVVDFGGGIGFGWAQLLIAGGALLLFLLALVILIRRRRSHVRR